MRFAAAADGAAGGAPVGDVAHAASGQRVGVALLREGLAKLDERALAALGDAALAATLRAAEAGRAATSGGSGARREAEPGRRRRDD